MSNSSKKLSLAASGTIFFVLETLLFSNHVQASVLGTWDVTIGGGQSSIVDQLEFSINLFTEGLPEEQCPGALVGKCPFLLKDISLTKADIGKVFTTTSVNSPSFNDVTSLLTNGINDLLVAEVLLPRRNEGGGAGIGTFESYAFFNDVTGTNRIDFQGYSITSISFVLNSLTFDSPGQDPNNNGIWTDFSFNGSLTVNGDKLSTSVPETNSIFGLVGFSIFGGYSILKKRLASSQKP